MPKKVAPRKPHELYKCPFCGKGYTHDQSFNHAQFHCEKKPK